MSTHRPGRVCFAKDEELCAHAHRAVAHAHFPVQTHAPLRRVLLNVTGVPQTGLSLRAADNEHINMYIPSQVNACLALQFHGPVSGLCRFRGNQPAAVPLSDEEREI